MTNMGSHIAGKRAPNPPYGARPAWVELTTPLQPMSRPERRTKARKTTGGYAERVSHTHGIPADSLLGFCVGGFWRLMGCDGVDKGAGVFCFYRGFDRYIFSDHTTRHILRLAAERKQADNRGTCARDRRAGGGRWGYPGRPTYDRTRETPLPHCAASPLALGRRVMGATQPRLGGIRAQRRTPPQAGMERGDRRSRRSHP